MQTNVRICFFGDSFVNGTGDNRYQGWVGRISTGLQSQGIDLTSYNLGIRRDTSRDILLRWRIEAERRLPCGINGRLVFSFGVNDCVEEAGVRRLTLTDSLKNAQQIIAEASAWRPSLFIGPPPMALVDQGRINDRILDLSDGFHEICTSHGVPFIDVFRSLIDLPEWKERLTEGDGAHP